MNPGEEQSQPASAAQNDVEQLLASAAQQEAAAPADSAPDAPAKPAGLQAHDFRNPMLISPRVLRKLRQHQEEFIKGMAARLSLLLRVEFSLKLSVLQTVPFQSLAESWASPSNLTLFKTEPLRGVSILEIPPRLGCALVDRLMGGPGVAPENPQELSEIEQALLEQVVQAFLDEWCGRWSAIKELKPVILGTETNGRFIQPATTDGNMLLLALEASLGECSGNIQFAFPYAALEPMIRQLTKDVEVAPALAPAPTPMLQAGIKWNSSLDEVRVPLTAEWPGLELSAREITALKIGDVIPLEPGFLGQVNVRLADMPKFKGRPGTLAGQWAVELTQPTNR